MTRQPFAMSPDYLAFVRGVRALHKLAVAGRDESPEADAIRDATDGPWEGLSETERGRVGGLSEDLYSLSDPPLSEPQEMNPQAQAKLTEAIGAGSRGEWDRALELLRRWRKYIAPAVLSFQRGCIWNEAGDPETAVLFFENAAQLDPENGNYLAAFLRVLQKVDPSEARRHMEQIVQNASDYAVVVVVWAVNIMLPPFHLAPTGEAVPTLRRLIPVLEQSLSRIEAGDEGGLDRMVYSSTVSPTTSVGSSTVA